MLLETILFPFGEWSVKLCSYYVTHQIFLLILSDCDSVIRMKLNFKNVLQAIDGLLFYLLCYYSFGMTPFAPASVILHIVDCFLSYFDLDLLTVCHKFLFYSNS